MVKPLVMVSIGFQVVIVWGRRDFPSTEVRENVVVRKSVVALTCEKKFEAEMGITKTKK